MPRPIHEFTTEVAKRSDNLKISSLRKHNYSVSNAHKSIYKWYHLNVIKSNSDGIHVHPIKHIKHWPLFRWLLYKYVGISSNVEKTFIPEQFHYEWFDLLTVRKAYLAMQ